jgi:hypothetical protein
MLEKSWKDIICKARGSRWFMRVVDGELSFLDHHVTPLSADCFHVWTVLFVALLPSVVSPLICVPLGTFSLSVLSFPLCSWTAVHCTLPCALS